MSFLLWVKYVLHIAVLSSSRATDLQAVIDAISEGRLDCSISVLLSNKQRAQALTRARDNGIEAVYIDSRGKDRERYDKELDAHLSRYTVDLIVLIGYMRLLSEWFVSKYRNKIVNIHPSLLPAFGGGMDLDVHEKVLASGVKVSGCTLHFVDEGADTGPIIMQRAVGIDVDETAATLKEKVQKAEQEVLVEALRLFSEKRVQLQGSRVRILKDGE